MQIVNFFFKKIFTKYYFYYPSRPMEKEIMVKSFIRERSENSEFICNTFTSVCTVVNLALHLEEFFLFCLSVILREEVPKNLRITLFITGDPLFHSLIMTFFVILRDKVPKNLRILLFTTGDPSSLRSSG